MVLLCFNGKAFFSLSFVLIILLKFLSIFLFLSIARVKIQTLERQRVACMSLYRLQYFSLRVCVCVCHTFREQKLYSSNTCVCEYAIATRLFCSWNELKPTTLPTLLKMLLDFDLCAHIYIYI